MSGASKHIDDSDEENTCTGGKSNQSVLENKKIQNNDRDLSNFEEINKSICKEVMGLETDGFNPKKVLLVDEKSNFSESSVAIHPNFLNHKSKSNCKINMECKKGYKSDSSPPPLHICDVCGKAFNRKNNLKRHMVKKYLSHVHCIFIFIP